MHQFAEKCCAILGVFFLAFVLVACGDEEPADNDPNQGVELECEVHEDCEGDLGFCDGEECVECLAIEDCPDGQGCVDNECIQDDTGCEVDDDCPYSSQLCVEETCRFVPRQCASAGDECEPGEPTRPGFSCENLGRGDLCYETCSENRVCIEGEAGSAYNCGRSEACMQPEGGVPVCQPSECEDFFDIEEGCQELEAHNPDALSDGKHCVRAGSGAYLCAGAGTAQEGDHCSETTDCGEGLVCVNELPQAVEGSPIPFDIGGRSFCAPGCDSDAMCDGDDQCIGADDGVFEGVGFCGDRCEPFGTDEERCSEDTACIPVSSEDGICFRDTNRERDYYDECTSNEQCPDSAHCLDIGLGSKCLPLCDPTLSTDEESSATCPGPQPIAYVQIGNYAASAGELAFYVDGDLAATLDDGEWETGEDGFVRVSSGQSLFEIERTSDEETVFSDTITLEQYGVTAFAAVDTSDEDSVALFANELPRELSADEEESKLRFVHGIDDAGSVDVVLEPESGDDIVVAEELGYEEATGFEAVSLSGESASYTLVVWPHGHEPQEPETDECTQDEECTQEFGDGFECDTEAEDNECVQTDLCETTDQCVNEFGAGYECDTVGDFQECVEVPGDACDEAATDCEGDEICDEEGNYAVCVDPPECTDETDCQEGEECRFEMCVEEEEEFDEYEDAYLVEEGFELSEQEVNTAYAVGTEELAATLYVAGYQSAPIGRLLGGDCFDLNATQQPPLPPVVGSGICLESCHGSDDWGQGKCSAEGDACQPVGGGVGWCFPAEDGEYGDECAQNEDCVDGLYCDMKGDGTGQCRSYCQPNEQTNDVLGCESDEICIAMDGYDNLGECRLPCDPGADGTDADCPENQRNCVGFGDNAYCSASGDIAHGEDCGSPTVQNCAPGMVCAKSGTTLQEVLAEPFTSLDEGEVATCRMTCEPFLGTARDSGCPDGYACSPVTPDGASRTSGHCVPAMDVTVGSLQACPTDEIGSMCDENSFCIRDQASECAPEQSICIQFCDHPTEAGCTDGTACVEGFAGGPLFGFMGLCR